MKVQEMLKDLLELGFSQAAIAESCGTSQPNIFRVLNGQGVRYELGKAIEDFYKTAMRNESRRKAG